jgi:hypothetical protein
LRNDPEEQRKWDRRVEEKEAAPTRNGKKHGSASSACSGSAVVSTCPSGGTTPRSTGVSTREEVPTSRERDPSASSVAATRGRSPSDARPRRKRRKVRSSSGSSSEKIKRRKESAVVGHTMMGVFWPMVVLQKHFKDQKNRGSNAR